MVLVLAVVGLLSVGPAIDAPGPAPVLPFTDVFVRDGEVVVVGKDFEATAARLVVSPDGKWLELCGTPARPATLTLRPGERCRSEQAGVRIVYWPADGKIMISEIKENGK
jgi:hypothetical protein